VFCRALNVAEENKGARNAAAFEIKFGSYTLTFMSHFMLERVVENNDFAVLPAPLFFADSDACAVAAHDTKMHAELLVRWAVVGYDMRARRDGREHG
jgi:hypothetical protein